MKHHRYLSPCLGLLTSCLLVGCASRPLSDAMIARKLPQAITIYDTVIVIVEGGETAPLRISNEAFSAALIESLRKAGLFRSVGSSGGATFRLEATLEDLAQPAAAFDMKVDLRVDWRLVRCSENQVLWHEKIDSTYVATVGDAFAGVNRLRLATEGAGRLNIEEGLAKLAAVKF